MLIKDWMATTILTVDANTSIMRATRTMKENNIRRLPLAFGGFCLAITVAGFLRDHQSLVRSEKRLFLKGTGIRLELLHKLIFCARIRLLAVFDRSSIAKSST